ncbi:hypothetical protein LZF95_07860 [Algoriphagus sp. AGSA1]|uniref:hypothetical protein n=1 Tax=Algoriphagus sp. AGSA1 TaxID=2907213 RepID=UPI001F27401C|nr:hypothetical protein [Algoriphagus sp. AGSA1]MCE7054585.1 hypothetical protein [Algoriphagus sp. AGSA1]
MVNPQTFEGKAQLKKALVFTGSGLFYKFLPHFGKYWIPEGAKEGSIKAVSVLSGTWGKSAIVVNRDLGNYIH